MIERDVDIREGGRRWGTKCVRSIGCPNCPEKWGKDETDYMFMIRGYGARWE